MALCILVHQKLLRIACMDRGRGCVPIGHGKWGISYGDALFQIDVRRS